MKNCGKPFIILNTLLLVSILSCFYFTDQSSVNKKVEVKNTSTFIEKLPYKGKETQNVIRSFDDYDSTNLPLIAALPKNNIYLYGIKPGGVVLCVNNIGHSFDWEYMTPRFVLPTMSLGDFDNNGIKELAVIVYIGSGTAVSINEIHIVDVMGKDGQAHEPEYFKDHVFYPKDYLAQLDGVIEFKAYKKLNQIIGQIKINNEVTTVDLDNYIPSDAKFDFNQKPYYGEIVSFYIEDNKLKVKFGIGVPNLTYATLSYFGDVYADIEYQNNKFTLRNLHFKEDND